ncbi:MAG: ATP-binding protein [Elusimicrobia bacterium]|nr:ATP-binding protein [Elusimicrobiota bacterium]
MARQTPKSASAVPSIVKDLVDQFDRPLDFFRELIQNSIDAGSNRIDVSVDYDGEKAVIHIEDDGEGMDEYIIDNFLLVLFRSTKEEDFTKIGKFGIGFVSVFALRPDLVRVFSAKNGESWRLDFPDYRRYEKYKLSKMREGTLVELLKKASKPDAEKLAKEARDTIRHWCRHADCRIYFRSFAAPEFELLSEPFRLEGSSLNYTEEGTVIELAFSAEEKPFFGFYNRGLTLKEGQESLFPGVAFKAKSRYLEHTLTRDNVMMDENYTKLMKIVGRLVETELPKRLLEELTKLAAELSAASARPARTPEEAAQRDRWAAGWGERAAFLRVVYGGMLARWKHSDWPVFPTLSGKPASLDELEDSADEADDRIYYDDAPNAVTEELEKRGILVLPAGVWTDCLAAWIKAPAVKASASLMRPAPISDAALPADARAFLETLRALDARSGAKYRGIGAADLAYEGSCVREKFFVTQKDPGALSAVDEAPVSSLLSFGRAKRWALLHAGHATFRTLARLHAKRPGLAAFLCLKMLHLHDGTVPSERESEFSNLAEKTEARLLEGAVRLDVEAAKGA